MIPATPEEIKYYWILLNAGVKLTLEEQKKLMASHKGLEKEIDRLNDIAFPGVYY